PKFYPIFLTALRTGMRQGEILGLQWVDIDWNGKFFEIRRASWLIGNGESLAYVKGQLGHHSIQITVDTYGHLIPGANRKAVNVLDDPGWDMDTETHPETSILRVISE
ncbi:MAG: hypothetical protein HY914_06930, partial [Desulfomonile tiedjei]|nr:hypothetical protein [Desulfomonile tiedjei]